MDFSDAFRLVNLGVGALMAVGGIFHAVLKSEQQLSSIIVGVYIVVFGLAVALLEFQIPPQISRYASFLFSFIGRGAFYIFAGSILLDAHTVDIVFGSIIGLIGIAYVVLEFIPGIEPPQNMREADGGWGAETV